MFLKHSFSSVKYMSYYLEPNHEKVDLKITASHSIFKTTIFSLTVYHTCSVYKVHIWLICVCVGFFYNSLWCSQHCLNIYLLLLSSLINIISLSPRHHCSLTYPVIFYTFILLQWLIFWNISEYVFFIQCHHSSYSLRRRINIFCLWKMNQFFNMLIFYLSIWFVYLVGHNYSF